MGLFDIFKKPDVQPVSSSQNKMSQIDKEKLMVEQATAQAMEQFSFLPFIFSGRELKKEYSGHPTAFMNLDSQNIKAASIELEKLNEYIKESVGFSDLIPCNILIPIDEIEYKQYSKAHGYSKLICTPLTATGKQSKYPLKFLFMTRLDTESIYESKGSKIIVTPGDKTTGEIVYGLDGQPATAKVNFWRNGTGYFYEFKTVGRTFLIYKIKTTLNTDEKGLPMVIYQFEI